MRIVDASYFYDANLKTEEDLLKQHYTTVGWAEALYRRNVEMIVIKRFHRDSFFQLNNVQYHFVKDRFGGVLKSWQLPRKMLSGISAANPDVVHLHNFSLSLQTLLLRNLLPKRTSIVIQHHGGPLPKGIKKSFDDVLNRVADGFFFTTIDQGKEWFKKKSVHKKIMPVMEGATFFHYENRDRERIYEYHDRSIARKKTGMTGSPAFLWVGRLDQNKDPLTVLNGFEILCRKHEAARLYMVYSEGNLVNAVKNRIAGSEVLKTKVQLLGKIAHDDIENYYNSADYFVLGSHYEGSGYALSEALRCGCVPIVTDIPSFKMMTGSGRLGATWKAGDIHSLTEAITSAMSKPLFSEANACIDFFRKNLSFDAIAEAATVHYRNIVAARSNLK